LTANTIASFYRNAIETGTGFEGQLAEDFQERLALAHAGAGPDQCDFYHTMELGEGEVIEGAWDLRGGERSYLGHVDVAGQRVLELGPATGHLSFFMERQGADVVAFDLAPGMAADIVPQEGHDIEAHRRLSLVYAERVRNSWWYGHRKLGSRCRAVYGDIYRLPGDLRRFDVSIFGAILMHLSKPFFALQQAAALTDKAIVVTDSIPSLPAPLDASACEFAPVDTTRSVVVWWQLTPGAVIRMLRVLGFLEFSVHYHVQKHHAHHDLGNPAAETLLYTVVAERHAGWAPRLERTESEREAELEVRRAWSRDEAIVEQLRAELSALRSSKSWRLTRPLRMLGSALRRAGLRKR
jgi:O-methyltransferase